MNPFIYEMEVFPGKKKLVIIWELTIKTLDEQIEILSYKLECAYVIDYKNKMSDSLERIENLLQLSFKCFSDNYEHLKLTHTVRLKEINQYYDNSKHHAQQIYQMVWK